MAIQEIDIRYIIVHSNNNLEKKLRALLRDVASTSYNIEDITGVLGLEIISTSLDSNSELSIVEVRVFDLPYDFIREFEESILAVDGVLEACKIYDSSKLEENQKFLAELYGIEMKIREIYTVVARLQGANLKNSGVKMLKRYRDGADVYKKRLMNEFFFIEFSDYKNVDMRKDPKLENLLDSLRQVRSVKDIRSSIIEISHPSLHLEERFNELSRIPEAIGRLENFRNNIAHNRYISENDIENFKKAKNIVDDVYNNFVAKIKDGEI